MPCLSQGLMSPIIHLAYSLLALEMYCQNSQGNGEAVKAEKPGLTEDWNEASSLLRLQQQLWSRGDNRSSDKLLTLSSLCLPHFSKRGLINANWFSSKWRCFLLILFVCSLKKYISLIKYCRHLKRNKWNVRLSVFLPGRGQWFILRNILSTQWE